jgi:cephalosporin-C deacetylase-like acetyl esterase
MHRDTRGDGRAVYTSELTFAVDGVRCSATLYRPDERPEEVSCVVMGHGLSLTRRGGIPDYAARFAAAGLAAELKTPANNSHAQNSRAAKP